MEKQLVGDIPREVIALCNQVYCYGTLSLTFAPVLLKLFILSVQRPSLDEFTLAIKCSKPQLFAGGTSRLHHNPT